jgi:HEXXH motif-containing protein
MGTTLEVPHDLTVPEEGSPTTRGILSKALGRTCRELLAVVRTHGAPISDDALAVERVLATLLRESPGAIASLLRYPHVSTLVRSLRSAAPAEAHPLLVQLLAIASFDLAWYAALPFPVTLRRLPARLVSRAARVVFALPPGTTSCTFQNGTLSAEDRTGRVESLDLAALARGIDHPWLERPYREVRGSIVLALADNNPLSGIEAHPDKKRPNTVDLGGHDEQEWLASLRGALATIERYLPGTSADIDVVLQQIVPTGFDAQTHSSCSYQEDIGTIYMSLHPQPMTMAEAIIHEVSHNKLNALLDLDPILENGPNERYASPVRPDPRPLHGVLLAVHAFMPVARLYERMTASVDPSVPAEQRQRLQARYAAVVRSNRAGMGVLQEHARPTRIGKGLLDELSAWERHFRGVG